MMTVEQIRVALKDLKISAVSRDTGLHYNTVIRVRDGDILDPRNSTVRALSKYFADRAKAQAGAGE